MTSPSAANVRVAKIFGIITVTCLLAALSGRATSAQPGPAAPQATFESQDAWRDFMAQVPMPPKGCFTASYPDTTWHEVPCGTAPHLPYPPARGPRSNTAGIVGDGLDYSADVTGTISTATGSFASVDVKSESGYVGGVPPAESNAYTLQLNSNFFSSAACSGAANPSNCQGWQQFVYSQTGCFGTCAFMQYWLINYAATCPANWIAYSQDCYTNSNSVIPPRQPIINLRKLSITGKAVSGGNDTLIFSVGKQLYTTQNNDNVVFLALGWQQAEFNIFGDCCGSEAQLAPDSTLVVRTRVDAGSAQGLSCASDGFTGETNNLSFVKDLLGPPPRGTPPEILFMESNSTSAKNGKRGQSCYAIK